MIHPWKRRRDVSSQGRHVRRLKHDRPRIPVVMTESSAELLSATEVGSHNRHRPLKRFARYVEQTRQNRYGRHRLNGSNRGAGIQCRILAPGRP